MDFIPLFHSQSAAFLSPVSIWVFINLSEGVKVLGVGRLIGGFEETNVHLQILSGFSVNSGAHIEEHY